MTARTANHAQRHVRCRWGAIAIASGGFLLSSAAAWCWHMFPSSLAPDFLLANFHSMFATILCIAVLGNMLGMAALVWTVLRRHAIGGRSTGACCLLSVAALSLSVYAFSETRSWSSWRNLGLRWTDDHNLKSIGLACRQYSADSESRFPSDLAILRDTEYLQGEKVYQCPCPACRHVKHADGYIYVASRLKVSEWQADALARIVVAYSRYPAHVGGHWNVLFANGHTESWKSKGEFSDLAENEDWILLPRTRTPRKSAGTKNDGSQAVPPRNSTGNENDGSEAESDRETTE